MSEIDWYYFKDGAQAGPVPHENFCAMFATGELRLDTMIWSKQFPDWTPAGTVGGFRRLAEAAPPPPPPPLPVIPLAAVTPGWSPTSLTPPPLPAWTAAPAPVATALPAIPVLSPAPGLVPSAAFPRLIDVAAATTAPDPVPAAVLPAAPVETAWAGPTLNPDFTPATGTQYDESGHALKATPAEAWGRWWARTIDLLIVGFLGAVVTALLGWDNFYASYCLSFSWLLVEPLLLSTWGTTPGKMVLGVEVRRKDGATLSYAEALNRTFGVYLKGMALNIPVLNVVTNIMAYNQLTAYGETVWDEEGGFRARVAAMTGRRVAAGVVATLLVLGLTGGVGVAEWAFEMRSFQAEMAQVQQTGAADNLASAEDDYADEE